MNSPSHITLRILVTGRVQGVWYRAWTAKEATARGLHGWVRNRRDGSVEAVFSGSQDLVEEMIAACHQGPPLARVDDIERHAFGEEITPGFHSLPTG